MMADSTLSLPTTRKRKPTELIRFSGSIAISRKAFLLGFSLVLLQIADALLTYAGLKIYGMHMEGNVALRSLMYSLNSVGLALILAKLVAIGLVAWVTIQAHSMRWVRPCLGFASGFFIVFAVVPWCVIILQSTY